MSINATQHTNNNAPIIVNHVRVLHCHTFMPYEFNKIDFVLRGKQKTLVRQSFGDSSSDFGTN